MQGSTYYLACKGEVATWVDGKLREPREEEIAVKVQGEEIVITGHLALARIAARFCSGDAQGQTFAERCEGSDGVRGVLDRVLGRLDLFSHSATGMEQGFYFCRSVELLGEPSAPNPSLQRGGDR